MKFLHIRLALLMTIITLSIPRTSFAWGKTGHGLVAEIAFSMLDEKTKSIVKEYLGKMSIEEAATWMDDERGNSYYNFMRTWHYIDIDKGEEYRPTQERNILSVLHSAITELKNYKSGDISKKEIRFRLFLIFHLVGDIHQPLHTGYTIDKGGNTIIVNSPFVSGNLHSVWDTQILEYKKVNLDTCLNYYKNMNAKDIADYQNINEMKWMYQSRSYLDRVYAFQNNYLDQQYIDNNIEIIKKQLTVAGIRLASVLKSIFNPETTY